MSVRSDEGAAWRGQPAGIAGVGRRPNASRLAGRIKSVISLVVVSIAWAGSAGAQVASTPAAPATTSEWTFAVAPYVWLATVRANFVYGTPLGGSVTDNVTAGINDYLSKLNFAGMIGAEARHERISLMTDGVFMSLSLTTGTNHFGQVNLRGVPVDIPRERQIGTGTRMNAGVWGAAVAYSVMQADWGNIDILAGMRLLALGSRTNYTLSSDITLPDRTLALTKQGSLSLGANYVDVVAGVRGRFNIPNSQFFIPFYFDIGTAGIPLTWQAYTGIGYSARIADLSLGYRYLAFRQNGKHTVENLSLGGAILAATFRF